jgi:hypothetical protein
VTLHAALALSATNSRIDAKWLPASVQIFAIPTRFTISRAAEKRFGGRRRLFSANRSAYVVATIACFVSSFRRKVPRKTGLPSPRRAAQLGEPRIGLPSQEGRPDQQSAESCQPSCHFPGVPLSSACPIASKQRRTLVGTHNRTVLSGRVEAAIVRPRAGSCVLKQVHREKPVPP